MIVISYIELPVIAKLIWRWVPALLLTLFFTFGKGGESVGAMFWIQTSFLALGIISLLALTRDKIALETVGLELPLAVFILIGFSSYLVSPYRFSTELELLWLVSCLCALLWLVHFPSEGVRKTLLDISVFVAMIQAGYCLIQFYLLGAPRAKGSFASPNHAATYIAAGIAYCYVRTISRGIAAPKRIFWLVIGGIGLWALVTTGSRSIFFSLGVVLVVSSMILGFGKKYILGLLVVLTVLLVVPSPIRDRILFSRTQDIYAVQRPKIWIQSAKIIWDHPIFGATLGNFEYMCSRYQFPVEGGVGRYSKIFTTADNGFLELGAETGIPGILCMGWGFLVGVMVLRNRLKGLEDYEHKTFLLAASVVIAVLLSQNLFHKVYRSPPSVWMGMVALSIIFGAKAKGKLSDVEAVVRVAAKKDKIPKLVTCYALSVIVLLGVWPLSCLRPYLAFRHYEEATRLQNANKLEEAERELRRAISLNSRQAFFFHRLGNIFMERFSLISSPEIANDALGNFQRAIQLNPANSGFWRTLGRYHEFMANFSQGSEREMNIEAASAAYQAAIELFPTNPFYRVSLAALYIKAGRYDKAVTPLLDALELEPNFVTAMVLFRDVVKHLGNTDQANFIEARLEETFRRLQKYRPLNEYEARLLMEPANYFAVNG